MRQFLFVVYFLADLAGCDIVSGNTITTRSDVDGITVLNSVTTTTLMGTQKFACLTSKSGKFHYLIFVDCPPEKPTGHDGAITPNRRDANCAPQVLQTFTVAAGQSRIVAGVDPNFRQCVSQVSTPMTPRCENH
jgi:hypothetical protein